MKTYYISTIPEYYGTFISTEMAYAEAEEIADAVVEHFPNITTRRCRRTNRCWLVSGKKDNSNVSWRHLARVRGWGR